MKRILTSFLACVLAFSPLALCVCAEGGVDNGMTFDENTVCKITKPFEQAPKTLEAWIKLPESHTDRAGVILGNYGSAKACLNFEIAKNGEPRFYYVHKDGTVHNNYFKCDIRTGDWVHIAFVYDSEAKELRFYLNGELKETMLVFP